MSTWGAGTWGQSRWGEHAVIAAPARGDQWSPVPYVNAGIQLVVHYMPHQTLPDGAVVVTTPPAGTDLFRGDRLVVTVAGPEPAHAPVAGAAWSTQLEQQLTDHGVTVTVHAEHSVTVPADHVTRTTPAGGVDLQPGSTLDVWVSDGAGPFTVPDLVGDALPAGLTANAARYGVTITPHHNAVSDDRYPAGFVVAQEPAAGSELQRGDTLNVYLSTFDAQHPWVHGRPDTGRWTDYLHLRVQTVGEIDPDHLGPASKDTIHCDQLAGVSWSVGCDPFAWNSTAGTAEVRIIDPDMVWHPLGRRGVTVTPGRWVWIDVEDARYPGTWVRLWTGFLRDASIRHLPNGRRETVWHLVDVPSRLGNSKPNKLDQEWPAWGVEAWCKRALDHAVANRTVPQALKDHPPVLRLEPGLPDIRGLPVDGTDYGQSTWAEWCLAYNSVGYRLWWGGGEKAAAISVTHGNYAFGGPDYDLLLLAPELAGNVRMGGMPQPPCELCPDQLAVTVDLGNVANVLVASRRGGHEQLFSAPWSLDRFGPAVTHLSGLLRPPADVSTVLFQWRAGALWELDDTTHRVVTGADLWPWQAPNRANVDGPRPVIAYAGWGEHQGRWWDANAMAVKQRHQVTPTKWDVTVSWELSNVRTGAVRGRLTNPFA